MNEFILSSTHSHSRLRHPEQETDRLAALQHAVEHAAHLLPSQGPIEVFVHHNTLHALEDLPFHEAVARGEELFGAEPYLSEDRYREELARGRIQPDDISHVLLEELGDEGERLVGFLGTRFHLRLAMLQHPLRVGPVAELEWLMAETDALRRFRQETPPALRLQMIEETRHRLLRDHSHGGGEANDPTRQLIERVCQLFGKHDIDRWTAAAWEAFTLNLLWEVCQQGVERVQHGAEASLSLPGVHEFKQTADGYPCDIDHQVNGILIRFCAAFLDQGFSHWRLPHRERGFFRAFVELYRTSRPLVRWLRRLPEELARIDAAGEGPLESLDRSLLKLNLFDAEREAFLTERLLALPGWAGMIWQMETNAEWAQHPAPQGTLVEFLAIRLLLERLALEQAGSSDLANDLTHSGHPRVAECHVSSGRGFAATPTEQVIQIAFQIFQLAQVRGWNPFHLLRLSPREWMLLVREINTFSQRERRKVYQLAYERRYLSQLFNALRWRISHTPLRRIDRPDTAVGGGTSFQIICCIDDREESFRRHIEEIDPACETYGAAGFFGVAMYYRGVSDAHFRPLCPNIIKPVHYVQEEVVHVLANRHQRQMEARRAIGKASHHWHLGTRTFTGGIVTGLLGSAASIPMVMRILFPRTTAQLRRWFGRVIQPPPLTELRMQRETESRTADHPGYTFDEMANIVERLLRDIGLTRCFSRLVILAGHGSSSLNNPHESAYNCGACSGGHGGANARVFCRMANHPRVRDLLAARGLDIPDETLFLGCEHDTCNDSVEFFDLDRLPLTHVPEFEHLQRVIDTARRRNAHERCRRFESAPLSLSPAEALQHVEGRAEDLSQARPEYNHATNAACIVGRRSLTRGLFLDRRTFLASYDPEQDDAEHSILARILQAVVPVCAGISLEYYFSCVDVGHYGCGSKLPHNITSLLGVMEGAASDLRPGLSAQMVEIHEPLRILFVVETTPRAMQSIMDGNTTIARLVRNEWVQLAVLDPERQGGGAVMHLYHKGRFEPYDGGRGELPVVSSSLAWYRGWRDHLGPAAIVSPSEQDVRRPHRLTDQAGGERT